MGKEDGDFVKKKLDMARRGEAGAGNDVTGATFGPETLSSIN